MNKSVFDKCIITKELHFEDPWQLFTHFSIVWFLGVFPIGLLSWHIFDLISVGKTSFKDGEIWLIIVPLLLMCLAYRLQKNILKFYSVHTALDRKQLIKVISDVSKKLEWITMESNKNVYVAKTFPGFFSGSWGEQITILFFEDKLLVNSICDPDKKSSIVSFGRNRNNVQTLLKELEGG
ncbi:hypothetical protein ACFQZS_01525 [Mucilaginibacter calamicampi]|uniref:YcxB-like protein domain-containing protein n=1 Tax=Mucilaginibacter calamicampi TaxID=1302352 RepID=A0ABW2YR46_9SPHI